jgi:hypothetical protein
MVNRDNVYSRRKSDGRAMNETILLQVGGCGCDFGFVCYPQYYPYLKIAAV